MGYKDLVLRFWVNQGIVTSEELSTTPFSITRTDTITVR